MENIYKTSELVKTILERYPDTRNSDNILYLKVLSTIGRRNGIDIDTMSMPHFLLHMKDLGFPPFESVRRTRQKLQASFPELSGTDYVETMRSVNEEEYRAYARDVMV